MALGTTHNNATKYSIPPGSVYAGVALDPKRSEIRLLELLPGKESTIIRCSLRVANFLQSPKYEAVSYVWGAMSAPDGRRRTIEIEGKLLDVTQNLHEALSDFRDDVLPRTLWVDAICINQGNEDEKSAQVAMMADIYKRASRILVYLGDADEGMAGLFSFFNRRRSNLQGSFDETVHRLGLDKWPLIRSFIAFCSKPWWSRIWIQQEYAMASQDPVFHVNGGLSTQATLLLQDLNPLFSQVMRLVFNNHEPQSYRYFGREAYSSAVHTITHARNILNLRHTETRGIGFSRPPCQVFGAMAQSRCTNPVDVMFGRRVFFEAVVQKVFQPDYAMPSNVLFEKLAIWLLIIDGWEELFWHFPYKQSHQLASWIPDFSRARKASVSDMDLKAMPRCKSTGPAIYQGILALHGHSIDVIDQVFDPEDASSFQQACNLWHLDEFFGQISRTKSSQDPIPLSMALPQLYGHSKLLSWCASNLGGMEVVSISAHLEQFTMFEFSDMVLDGFARSMAQLEAFYQDNEGAASSAPQDEVASPDTPNSVLRREWSKIPGHNSTMQLAIAGVMNRLLELQTVVLSLKHPDCLGAFLFDYENLVGQIKHLKIPQRRGEWPHQETAALGKYLSQLLLEPGFDVSNILDRGQHSIRHSLDLGSTILSYEDLQAAVTNCESEEEVKLRVTLILQIACIVNSSLNPDDNWKGPCPSKELQPDRRVESYLSEIRKALGNRGHTIRELEPLDTSPPPVQQKYHTGTEKLKRAAEILKDRGWKQDKLSSTRTAYEFTEFLRERTFFVTKHGLAGVAIRGVTGIKAGDKLVMLANVQLPMVIRPTVDPKYHTIVGHAGVRGLSDAAFHELDRHEKPERSVFKLK
jgi:hypothetical protein